MNKRSRKARKVQLQRKLERRSFTALPDWTPREAQQAQEEYMKAGGEPLAHHAPLPSWFSARYLLELRAQLEAGNKGVILRAVAECARTGKPLPDWLARAFLDAWRSVIHYEAKTWDEVFGRAHPKGINLRAEQKRWKLKWQVQNEVREASKKGRPIDDELFSDIGKRLHVGKTLVKEYYADRPASLPREVRALLLPFRQPPKPKAKPKRR